MRFVQIPFVAFRGESHRIHRCVLPHLASVRGLIEQHIIFRPADLRAHSARHQPQIIHRENGGKQAADESQGFLQPDAQIELRMNGREKGHKPVGPIAAEHAIAADGHVQRGGHSAHRAVHARRIVRIHACQPAQLHHRQSAHVRTIGLANQHLRHLLRIGRLTQVRERILPQRDAQHFLPTTAQILPANVHGKEDVFRHGVFHHINGVVYPADGTSVIHPPVARREPLFATRKVRKQLIPVKAGKQFWPHVFWKNPGRFFPQCARALFIPLPAGKIPSFIPLRIEPVFRQVDLKTRHHFRNHGRRQWIAHTSAAAHAHNLLWQFFQHTNGVGNGLL